MKKNSLGFKTLLFMLTIMISTCGIVYAQFPPIPSDYSGYVTVNSEPAPDGALVYAKIENYTSDSVVVDGGRYRYLLVAPPDDTYEDKTIEFYVDPDADGPMPAIMAAETGIFELLGDSYEIDLTVVIVDSTKPVISGISSSEVTTSGAKIKWATDEPSTSQVDYGKTTAYGSQKASTAPVTSHSITLTGLEDGTTYHFRVVSTDKAGNIAHSSDYTFKTAATSPPSPPPMPPSPTNEDPVADAGPNQKAWIGSRVYFDGSKSEDPDGTIVEYHWFPGDGSYKPGVMAIHIYEEAGVYTASLTVTDNNGVTNTDNCTVKISEPPAPVSNKFVERVQTRARHVVDALDEANTTVTLDTTDDVTVTILKYEGNPQPLNPIPEMALPNYVDIEVSDPNAVVWPIYVEMHYHRWEVEGLEESSLGIYYWFNGTWQRCSDTGVDTERNVVWAYMTAEEASGSPILIAGMHAIITPPLPPFLDNLTVTPSELELGDNVTISVDIRNPNDIAISYGFTMEVEEPIWIHIPWNAWTELVFVELEAYESKTVSRTMTPTVVGTHNVTVIGMTGNFTVKAPPKPAEFVVSDLTITPEEAELGEGIEACTFEITVYVANIGEQEGIHTVNLKMDGDVIQAGTVTLWGEEKTSITFDVTRGIGSYTVEVDGLTGSFTVKAPPKPAEFLFSGLEVTPMEVEEGLKVTVTVDISNVGELEGGRTVELKVDGYVVDSEEVILEGGESVMVLFDLTRDEGIYQVEVEGMTDSFTVFTLPVAPPIWMRPETIAGIIIVAAVLIVYAYWKGIIPPLFPGMRAGK